MGKAHENCHSTAHVFYGDDISPSQRDSQPFTPVNTHWEMETFRLCKNYWTACIASVSKIPLCQPGSPSHVPSWNPD